MRDIKNTIGDTKFGTSLADLEDGDLHRGYFDATPVTNTEMATDPSPFSMDDEKEVGFVHRPLYKSDVERN